jgi:hypothetical protein
MRLRRVLLAIVSVASILVMTASQALAFDCIVANKPIGAGSAATIDFDSGTVTPNKPNPGTEQSPHGAFVTVTGSVDGQTITVDTFVRAPMDSQAPFAEPGVIPGATKQEQNGGGCDGKGLDTIEACFFGQ